jgi:hypothetical protein
VLVLASAQHAVASHEPTVFTQLAERDLHVVSESGQLVEGEVGLLDIAAGAEENAAGVAEEEDCRVALSTGSGVEVANASWNLCLATVVEED